MSVALDDHEGSVSIGGLLINNFRFADDIVVNAEDEEEAGVLEDRHISVPSIHYYCHITKAEGEVGITLNRFKPPVF